MIIEDNEIIIDDGNFQVIKGKDIAVFRSGGSLLFSPVTEDGTPETWFDEVEAMIEFTWENDIDKKKHQSRLKRAIGQLAKIEDGRTYPCLK